MIRRYVEEGDFIKEFVEQAVRRADSARYILLGWYVVGEPWLNGVTPMVTMRKRFRTEPAH